MKLGDRFINLLIKFNHNFEMLNILSSNIVGM